MRVAVPSESGDGLMSMRSGHFGHCAYFTVATIEDGQIVSVESVKNVDHDAVGCGGVIDFAIGLNLDAIIVVGMGRPPFMRFTAGGIGVYREQMTPMVGDVLQQFIAGNLPQMGEGQACSHH